MSITLCPSSTCFKNINAASTLDNLQHFFWHQCVIVTPKSHLNPSCFLYLSIVSLVRECRNTNT